MDGFAIAAIISAIAVLVSATAGAITSIIRELRAIRGIVEAQHVTIKEIDEAVNDKRAEDPTMRQNLQKLRDRSDRNEP